MLRACARHLPPPPTHALGVTAWSPGTVRFGKPLSPWGPCGSLALELWGEPIEGGTCDRRPLAEPAPHFCCSLPWDSVPSDGSSAVPRSARRLPAASLHGRLPALRPCRRDRPVSRTDRYFSLSSHGPAVQGAPGSGSCHHAQPSRRRPAGRAAATSPGRPGAASPPGTRPHATHRCVSIVGKGAGTLHLLIQTLSSCRNCPQAGALKVTWTLKSAWALPSSAGQVAAVSKTSVLEPQSSSWGCDNMPVSVRGLRRRDQQETCI